MIKHFRKIIMYGQLSGLMTHYERLRVGGWDAEAAAVRQRITEYIVRTET